MAIWNHFGHFMPSFAEFRTDINSTHKSKTPWCILSSDCGPGLTKLQISKTSRMFILSQKWSFFGLFEGVTRGYTTCVSSILKKHPFAPQYPQINANWAKIKKWQPQKLRGTILILEVQLLSCSFFVLYLDWKVTSNLPLYKIHAQAQPLGSIFFPNFFFDKNLILAPTLLQ